MRSGESVTLRRFKLRDDFMRWLYKQHLAGIDRPPFSHFLAEGIGDQDHPYEEAEVHGTTKWLKDMGFIEGMGASQTRGGVLRPGLTTLGMNRVEQRRSVNEQENTTMVNISATNSNVAYQSSHTSQSLVLTERDTSDVQAAINGVVALLDSSSISAEQGIALQDAVDVLEGEVAHENSSPEKLKRWLEHVVSTLAPVGAVADVAAVVGLVQTAIGSLG